jgi:hypothetical protein
MFRETDGEVTIAGRTFTLGTAYAPRQGSVFRRPRRLLGCDPGGLLPGGRVELAMVPSGLRQAMAGEEWVAWAGEPVEDVGR